jgi:hypothetical protein
MRDLMMLSVAPNGNMIVSTKFQSVRKEAKVACFKVLAQKSPGGTKESHENFQCG